MKYPFDDHKFTLRKAIGHLKTIMIHKYWVFHYACKLGIPFAGLIHDLSKFTLVEFIESVRFYQGGKSSPIPVAKAVQGYSLAWQHHKGHNPHHYEHWTDNYDSGTTTIKIPFKYIKEMIADWLGACHAYSNGDNVYQREYEWWNLKRTVNPPKIHPETIKCITAILNELMHNNFDLTEIQRNYENLHSYGEL